GDEPAEDVATVGTRDLEIRRELSAHAEAHGDGADAGGSAGGRRRLSVDRPGHTDRPWKGGEVGRDLYRGAVHEECLGGGRGGRLADRLLLGIEERHHR